jgi:transposase InsO family protein
VKEPVGKAEKLRQQRIGALLEAHADDAEFGYRLLADEARQLGFPMADRTAWRLCNQSGIMSAIVKTRKRKGKTPGPPVCDDLVQRDFTAGGPNQLWLVDITEHRTREGKIYLCAVKDVFSRRIVGYSIAERMKARLAVDAVNNAVSRRGNVTGCIVHSDRGSQFRSRKFLHALTAHGLVGSMGRVGAAGDNAAMESFFALLQNNVLNRRTWITREQLRTAIVWWIERTYHRRRRQAALGRLTPVEFETMMATPVALAA